MLAAVKSSHKKAGERSFTVPLRSVISGILDIFFRWYFMSVVLSGFGFHCFTSNRDRFDNVIAQNFTFDMVRINKSFIKIFSYFKVGIYRNQQNVNDATLSKAINIWAKRLYAERCIHLQNQINSDRSADFRKKKKAEL